MFLFSSSAAVRTDGVCVRPAGGAPESGGPLVFGPFLEVKLIDDQFEQRVLLEHLRLGLHVYRVVGAGSRSGKDIAQVEEILIDALDLDGRLRTVEARLDGANESGGEHAESGEAAQGGLAPVERPDVIHEVPLPARVKTLH